MSNSKTDDLIFNEPTSQQSQRNQHNKCKCCREYGDALVFGLFRKKQIGNDMKELLKTGLNRCLNTLDLTAYGLGEFQCLKDNFIYSYI
ncbi:unnamed protein product [Trichobilharzia regenti]|nr:unnamed protein product [Trichobilharzia regenti]